MPRLLSFLHFHLSLFTCHRYKWRFITHLLKGSTYVIIIMKFVQGTQGFFFTSTHPNFHPLVFSLGTTFDYMSSQAGTPQVTRPDDTFIYV